MDAPVTSTAIVQATEALTRAFLRANLVEPRFFQVLEDGRLEFAFGADFLVRVDVEDGHYEIVLALEGRGRPSDVAEAVSILNEAAARSPKPFGYGRQQ